MTPSRLLRIAIDLIAVIATVYGAAGIVLIAIIANTVLFAAWEVVLVAVCFDLLWTAPVSLHTAPWYTLLAIALLWATEPVRREFLS